MPYSFGYSQHRGMIESIRVHHQLPTDALVSNKIITLVEWNADA